MMRVLDSIYEGALKPDDDVSPTERDVILTMLLIAGAQAMLFGTEPEWYGRIPNGVSLESWNHQYEVAEAFLAEDPTRKPEDAVSLVLLDEGSQDDVSFTYSNEFLSFAQKYFFE